MNVPLPDEKTFRFLAILQKNVPTPKLLRALGHMTAGVVAEVGKEREMCFLEYRDKDGGNHPGISHYPFTVLTVETSDEIRKIRNNARTRGLFFTDFTSTMEGGSSSERLEMTAQTPESDLDYYGICFFAASDILRELTDGLPTFE